MRIAHWIDFRSERELKRASRPIAIAFNRIFLKLKRMVCKPTFAFKGLLPRTCLPTGGFDWAKFNQTMKKNSTISFCLDSWRTLLYDRKVSSKIFTELFWPKIERLPLEAFQWKRTLPSSNRTVSKVWIWREAPKRFDRCNQTPLRFRIYLDFLKFWLICETAS